jgi:F1F0 ATPase subunit 2
MTEFMSLTSAMAAGVLLGAIFFGGLWYTVSQGLSSERPELWFLGGMLLRMSITLAGFYLVGRERWDRWLICLLGFFIARLAAGLMVRPPGRNAIGRAPEVNCAP